MNQHIMDKVECLKVFSGLVVVRLGGTDIYGVIIGSEILEANGGATTALRKRLETPRKEGE
jgi:hypothetical protein